MLTINSLRYFVDAAAAGSVAQAAKAHRLSSSAISQAIRVLEGHFETELLVHSRNRFALTYAGQVLFERSREVFDAIATLESEMAWTKGAHAGAVVFATQQSFAVTLLPAFLGKFLRAYPRIIPRFFTVTTDAVQQLLAERAIEFGLTVDNVPYADCECQVIVEGEYILVEAAAAAADPSRLPADERFIISGQTKTSDQLRKAYERAYKTPLPVAMEVKSWGVIKRLAIEGLGIGQIPDYMWEPGDAKTLRLRTFATPTITYRIGAYYRRDRPLSRPAQLFLKELAESCIAQKKWQQHVGR